MSLAFVRTAKLPPVTCDACICPAGEGHGTWCSSYMASPQRCAKICYDNLLLLPSLHHLNVPSANAQIHALQFEWAWQHPQKSLAVREEAATLKKTALNGAQGKVPNFRLPPAPVCLCMPREAEQSAAIHDVVYTCWAPWLKKMHY